MIKKKSHFLIILFFSLVFIWLYFVISHLSSIGYFSATLEDGLSEKFLGDYRGDPLLKGDIVSFDYPSRYPMFGMVEVKFNAFNRVSDDVLEFRIKKPGTEDWYYTGQYKADQFQSDEVFPFGFPIINDSSGKNYYIEIESLNGATESSVAIKSPLYKSVVVGKHVFTREQLSSSPKLLVYFSYHKILNILNNPEHFFHLLLYSLPLIFFIMYSLVGMSLGLYSLVIFISVAVDIMSMDIYYSFFIISVMIAWILNVRRHKVSSQVSVALALALITVSVPLNLAGFKLIQDRMTVWSYMFLSFGVIQIVYEINIKPAFRLSLLDYWNIIRIEWRNATVFTYLCLIGEVTIIAKNISNFNTKAGHRIAVDSLNNSQLVALIVYRFGNQMMENIIITSRALSFIIISLMTILNFILRYGPYAVFLWVSYSLYNQISHMVSFFQDFFVLNQISLFWSKVGTRLSVLLLTAVVIFYFLQRKRRFLLKIYIAIALLIITGFLSEMIFSKVTFFRNDLLIWFISPSDTSEAWADVTVIGRNFNEMPSKGKVLIDGKEQRIIRWSDREIIFRTDPSTTRSGNLIVKTSKGRESDSIYFSYTGNK